MIDLCQRSIEFFQLVYIVDWRVGWFLLAFIFWQGVVCEVLILCWHIAAPLSFACIAPVTAEMNGLSAWSSLIGARESASNIGICLPQMVVNI